MEEQPIKSELQEKLSQNFNPEPPKQQGSAVIGPSPKPASPDILSEIEKNLSQPSFNSEKEKYNREPYIPQKTKIKILPLVIAISLAIIIMGTAGVLASLYMRFWDPLWNPFREKPENVVSKMVSNMSAIKAFHYEAVVGLTANTGDIKANATVSGDLDTTAKNSPKASNIIKFNSTAENAQGKTLFSFESENRQLENNYYIIATNFNIPFLEPIIKSYGIDAGKITGQWQKLTGDSAKSYSEKSGGVLDKLKKLLSENRIYAIKKEFEDDKIGAKETYHYLFSLNKESFGKIVDGLFGEAAKQYIADFGDLDADVWIGKKDNMLYRIKIQKTINAEKFNSGLGATADINLEIDFSNFNESIIVVPPEQSNNMEDLINTAATAYLAKQLESSKSQIITDMAQVKFFIESNYGVEKTFAKANCQREELKAICENIKNVAGVEPVIFGNARNYCAFVKLPSKSDTDKRYYCINKTVAVETDVEPAFCNGKTYICPAAAKDLTPVASP